MNDFIESIPSAWKDRLILLFLGALVGIGGAGQLGVFRGDPFTGKMGDELEGRVNLRITQLKDACAEHYNNRTTRLVAIEHRMTAIEKADANLAKIVQHNLDHIETHNKEAEPWKRAIEANSHDIANIHRSLGWKGVKK